VGGWYNEIEANNKGGFIMVGIIFTILFIGLPLAAMIFWIICLEEYIRGRQANKRQPESVSADVMMRRKAMLVVSSVIAGTLLACVLGLVALFYMAIAFM
jgi:hypothetical protein